MPEASINDFKMARADQFTARLQVLLCRYAKAIQEIGSSANTNASAGSKNLAARVLSDPGGMAGKIAISLAGDGNVSGTYTAGPPEDSTKTDAQLEGVIQAVWNSGSWDNVL